MDIPFFPWQDGDQIDFSCIWGSSQDNIYVASHELDNQLLHFDGSTWRLINIVSNSASLYFYEMWGTAADNIYAIVMDGPFDTGVAHFDGTQWTVIDSTRRGSGMLFWGAIWGTDANNVFAANGNQVCHYDGRAWKKVYQSDYYTFSVWGSDSNNVFVGQHDIGLLLHYNGIMWEQQSIFNLWYTAFNIWGTAADDIYVVSDRDEYIFHYDGTAWRRSTDDAFLARALWGMDNFIIAGGKKSLYTYFK